MSQSDRLPTRTIDPGVGSRDAEMPAAPLTSAHEVTRPSGAVLPPGGGGIGVAVAVGLCGLLPVILGGTPYVLGQLNYALVIALMAVGMNITFGFAGQFFIGLTAPFGVSAYLIAVLANDHAAAQSLGVMIIVGVAASIAFTLIMALPALRISGFYLGMMSLFVAVVIPQIALHTPVLGNDTGISLISNPEFEQYPAGVMLYEVGVLLLMLVTLASVNISTSRLGRRFFAIRAGDVLAQSLGIEPYKTKLVAFLLASFACGVAAAFYVHSQQFVSPGSVDPQLSITILAAVVVGGTGTIFGPLVGVAVVMGFDQFLGSFKGYQGILFGLLLAIVAMAFPEGLVGLIERAVARLRGDSGRSPTRKKIDTPRPQSGLKEASEGGIPAPGITPCRRPNVPHTPLHSREGERLSLRNVSRSFGGVHAVSGVSLDVRPGEIHSLVGPNGSGKTTLLNLICGYYSLDSGEIRLGEKRLDRLTPAGVARSGIARTFQTPHLMGDNSLLENVLAAADRAQPRTGLRGLVESGRSARGNSTSVLQATAALQRVGLGDAQDKKASLASHGTQRLIEIARAVTLDPIVLLLDEPAAGQAGSELEALMNVIRSAAEAGFGVLLVEHNLPVVFELADYITVLHRGKIIASGTPADVRGDEEVARVYLGR